MQCPRCFDNNSRVLDSRPIENGNTIRRRRECEKCEFRFTTFERKELAPIIIVKKDETRQEFRREKLVRGLMRACEKRPVTIEEIELVAVEVEQAIRNSEAPEVSSQYVGDLVLERLSKVDEVAYIRFASVYRQFDNIGLFLDELKEILQKKE